MLRTSRLGSHRCPNGHLVAPSIATQSEEIICPAEHLGLPEARQPRPAGRVATGSTRLATREREPRSVRNK